MYPFVTAPIAKHNLCSGTFHQARRGPNPSWRHLYLAGLAIIGLALGMLSLRAHAGVTATVSRVVFSMGATEHSLQLVNANKYPVLVQAWVDDGRIDSIPQDSKAPIIVLPPIFRMAPGDKTSLRLIYSNAPLAQDRESLFWLNLYEIPPTKGKGESQSDAPTITVTMRTQMKVFVRPEKLPIPVSQLPDKLAFALRQRAGALQLMIDNPTPYYATLSALRVTTGGVSQDYKVDMIAPKSQTQLALDAALAGSAPVRIDFQLINDEGNPVAGERNITVSGLNNP